MKTIARRMFLGGYMLNGHYVPTMEELIEYQAMRGDRYADSVKYGYGTVWFCLATLAVFFVARWLKVITLWARVNRTPQVVPKKLLALLRLFSYPRLPYSVSRIVNTVWTIGSLGPNIMLFIALLFTSLYCWVARYYYSAPFYGSPPLALRSEWIATALIPFVFVLGAKRNLISWVVGVSHEKLQVFHQGVAFLIVYMSLVHTISMIVQACSELPFRQHYVSDYIWWSGFAALGALLWLWLGSLPMIRHHLYEGFYLLHIAASIMFIGFLYYHGFGLLDTE
ncbi:SubName: Full=Related to ferric reductase {ECO:0000313/EMBL:CCA75406.1} [Serendipita indica DSM 11827]|nr:SubName: Full=Related to ferric reductase {ECO:0000313/EMBL:CCA75406.1} [Serendipita indica DSM 11827]